jgi:hypothetical protein
MATEEKTKKDFFDKLSSLSGVFIAIAGFMATYLYNNNQIKIQEAKTNAEINSTKIDLMEKCMKYVISSNPKEREFGYQVFVINGYQDLALKLIYAKSDSAGGKIVQSIASNEKSKFSNEAKIILSKSQQAQTFEINGFNYLLEQDIDNAITSFRNSENSYSSFHQVYEIERYLEKNKKNLSNKDSEIWREAYRKLLKDYSWGMPNDIKIKLTEKTK